MNIRFDDQVAIVTGGAIGLGRSHVLGLARRGAKVVINDLGGALDGAGRSSAAAEAVAAEVEALGGEALVSGADVADPGAVEAMVAEVMDRWGRVDIIVHNAGILRDKSFAKMALEDFRAVTDVHLMGAVHCAKAVWGAMREQGYGRIAFTSASSGFYGNFGQANYTAAKIGLVGLMQSLHWEGEKHNIRINCLCPFAGTRMSEGLVSDDVMKALAPEYVTPGLLYLVSRDAPSRAVLRAGGGAFALMRILETEGVVLKRDALTAEAVAENWEAIAAPQSALEYQSIAELSEDVIAKAMNDAGR